MPRESDRKEICRQLRKMIELEILMSSSSSESGEDSTTEGDDDSNDSDVDLVIGLEDETDSDEEYSSIRELIDLMDVVESSRYLSRRNRFEKSQEFLYQFFMDLPSLQFRQLTRMDRDSFLAILAIIKDHEVFQNRSAHPQAPVLVQLAVALDRFGHDGNGACLNRTMLQWGVSHGSMVNYTNRVMVAIQSCMRHEIRWPDSEDRRCSSAFFASLGFPGCIALIDGTLVKLSQRPKEDGETYFDRKSNYSMNVQVVCDQNKRVLYFSAGMPGSCHDVTCLRRSSLWQKMDTSELFEHNQYMLGDSGYVSHHRLVTAFKNTAGDRDKTDFNTCVAHARVGNEHCIGIVKARWHSLRELRTQLRNRKENAYVVRWIRCCIILHNFLTWKKDEWTEADGPVVLEQEVNLQAHLGSERDRNILGVMRREEVQRYCLDFNRRPGGVLNR